MLVTLPLSKNHQCVSTTDFSVIEESVGRGNHCYCKCDMCPKGQFDINIKNSKKESPSSCVNQTMESERHNTLAVTDESNYDNIKNSRDSVTDLNILDKVYGSLEKEKSIGYQDTANVFTDQSPNDSIWSFTKSQEVGTLIEKEAVSVSENRATFSVEESQQGINALEKAQSASGEGQNVLTSETPCSKDNKEEVTVSGFRGSEMSASASTCLTLGASPATDEEENSVMLDKKIHNVSETTGFASENAGTILQSADSKKEIASSADSYGSREPQTVLESLDSSDPCISGSEYKGSSKLTNSSNSPTLEVSDENKEPENARHPSKDKEVLESPHSLRALLSFKDDIPDDVEKPSETKKTDDVENASDTTKHESSPESKKDGEKPVVAGAENNGNDNHAEPIVYPDKWYENADSDEFTSGTFSGPIAFSGALTYSGLMAYSAPPHSGNISHRSDSSTSTRSFAFPILASDWSSSPVKTDPPETRMNRQGRKWRFCFCFRCSSTTFD